MKCLIILFMLIISQGCRADEIEFIGCVWDIPDRFNIQNRGIWKSSAKKASIIYFSEDYFSPDLVNISAKKTVRKRAVSFYAKENGYEMAIYSDMLKVNGNISAPSWVAIQNMEIVGSIYLKGFSNKELLEFTKHCMPSISYDLQ